MPDDQAGHSQIETAKFKDPLVTAGGERRAWVKLKRLETLWFNTGTLCNIACVDCYIESSPRNDRLSYLTPDDVLLYLYEIERNALPVREIGFTGGEPFMNPHIIDLLESSLVRGFHVLVLTNAMKPLHNRIGAIRRLGAAYGGKLKLRVSIDHPEPGRHEELRGANSWKPMVKGLQLLAAEGLSIAVAGRTRWREDEGSLRRRYAGLFQRLGLDVDADDPSALVLFPEMDEMADVPEITTACWGLLDVDPNDMMCATSRMVVKRKDAAAPVVLPCTLLPYDTAFDMGASLRAADGPVPLNHPHCAKFCVLGGGSCSAA